MSGNQCEAYNFSESEKVSKEAVRNFSLLQENFAHAFAGRLTGRLRVLADASFVSIEQMLYGDFITAMKMPTFVLVIAMRPLAGSIAVELSANLGYSLIDRLLGGPGAVAVAPRRAPSELELKLLDHVAADIIESLRETWVHIVALSPELQARETNPQLVQIVAPSELALVCRFKIDVGGVSGAMTVGVPVHLLNLVMDKIGSQRWILSQQTKKNDSSGPGQITQLLAGVRLPLTAHLGQAKITLRRVFALQAGEIIMLAGNREEIVKILVREKLKFYGKVGVVRNKRAVQVTRCMSSCGAVRAA
ncbi:MAG: flagellar motor switch protein FliM [Candidatus Omnitrophica bacterium]|nr:flagellar motor switch protein FliM [Candidatus Omnitrophota bacterium]